MTTVKTTVVASAVCMLMLTTSCVSSKKYKEMTASRDNCEVAKSACLATNNKWESDYNTLKAQKDLLEAQTSETIKQKERELADKEAALLSREQTVARLTAMINEQNRLVSNLKNKVSEALVGYAPEELSIEIRDGKVYVSLAEELLFPSGSDKVYDKGADALKKLAEALAKNNDPDITVAIEGHTDTIPINTSKFADNWDLSVHRATSIIRILTKNGVDPDQIIASGRGENYPVASNSTPEGRQKNRRTEIILSPKLDELWDILY